MKTIYIILLTTWFCITTVTIHGQSPIQKKYENETYSIYGWTDSLKIETGKWICIVNSKNKLDSEKLKDKCNCNVPNMDGLSIIKKVMKSVFSVEKQKALAAATNRKAIRYALYYNAETGQILYIEFQLYGMQLSEKEESDTAVTLKEIYQLETQLKTQRLKVDCDCTHTQSKYSCDFYSMSLNNINK